MLNSLIEDLRILAESILKEEQVSDVQSKLDQARILYEKLLILDHLEKEPITENESPAFIEENDDGNIEYKLRLDTKTDNSIKKLKTQTIVFDGDGGLENVNTRTEYEKISQRKSEKTQSCTKQKKTL